MFHRTAVHLRGLLQRTVWGQYAGDKIPPRLRSVFRVVLPLVYLFSGLYGLTTIGLVLPSINLIFGDLYSDFWSIALLLGGMAALVGIVFYDTLVWLELAGASFIVTLMAFYAAAVVIGWIWYGSDFRLASLIAFLIFIPFPAWRAYDAAGELRPRNV